MRLTVHCCKPRNEEGKEEELDRKQRRDSVESEEERRVYRA